MPPKEKTHPKPWVLFRHPYGDFPQYKAGDICENPSEEMLRVAATSSCMTILTDEDVILNDVEAAPVAADSPPAESPPTN